MALLPDGTVLEAASQGSLLVALVVSAVVLVRLGTGRRPLARLRARLVLGVPWGTLVVCLLLFFVYYVAQGAAELGEPVVVGFRSWSYSYPVGMVLAPFAHSGEGHLVGNLFSTVVFAPLAEYAWSHYPTTRGSSSFGSALTNPYVRILGFVLGVIVVGLATSVFLPGALIGFSGVVFAFAGFVLVTRPVLAVFGLVAEGVVELLYFAVDNPVLTARGRTVFDIPGWANVAVQGHTLGLLLGALLGVAVVRRRGAWPDLHRVFFGVVVFAVAKQLWAFYWFLGGTEYVLFQGVGLATVTLLAVVITVAVARTDRTLVSRIDLSGREAATGLLLAAVLAMAVAAVPYNTVAVSPGEEADSGVQVRDYTITYGQNVPDRYISAVRIPFVSEPLEVYSSGVVVASDRRNAWEVVAPAGRLEVRGAVTVPVGGLGWRERVVVNRTAWSLVDGTSTYKVFVRTDSTRKQVFAAEPATAPVVINHSRISIRPAGPGYELAVSRNETVVDTSPIPASGGAVTAGDIRFNRTENRLVAAYRGTRIPIATYELRTRNRP